jgi:hypothetical protein
MATIVANRVLDPMSVFRPFLSNDLRRMSAASCGRPGVRRFGAAM